VHHVNLTLVKQLNPSDGVVELRQHSEGAECDDRYPKFKTLGRQSTDDK
jgi:hypothetical protein